MGWFSSSSATTSTEPQAPNRSQRAVCWEARDAFFKCLDRHGIIDSLAEKDKATQVCGKEDMVFEKQCFGSWVEYFKKRRVVEYKKQELIKSLEKEGANKIEGGTIEGAVTTKS